MKMLLLGPPVEFQADKLAEVSTSCAGYSLAASTKALWLFHLSMCIEMSRFLCLIATSGPSLPFPGPPKISKRGTSLETGSTRAHGPRMIINQSCSKNGKYLLELAQSISSLCTSYESYCVLNVTESTELFLCLAPMSEDFRTGSTIQPFMNAAKSYMRVSRC